jgi:hypothetical protein
VDSSNQGVSLSAGVQIATCWNMSLEHFADFVLSQITVLSAGTTHEETLVLMLEIVVVGGRDQSYRGGSKKLVATTSFAQNLGTTCSPLTRHQSTTTADVS